jgi:hypothetical protein
MFSFIKQKLIFGGAHIGDKLDKLELYNKLIIRIFSIIVKLTFSSLGDQRKFSDGRQPASRHQTMLP